MSGNSMNEDLRSIKTKKALYSSMFSLLKKISFRKITVKEICDEAMVSRATFYSHFIDKYELLKFWLTGLCPQDLNSNYEQLEQLISRCTRESILILKNLFCDADYETFDILFEFILTCANLPVPKNTKGENSLENVVFSNFYAGGFISYLLWQVRNKFPSDTPILNQHLYEMINDLQKIKTNRSEFSDESLNEHDETSKKT